MKNKRKPHRRHALERNPVTLALVRNQIAADVERLRTAAGLHTYTGNGGAEVTNLVGRLTYIVCWAAGHHGLHDTPEARILAGTANALAELAAQPHALEQQRATLIAGLAAIDRIMPQVSTTALAAGALELDELLRMGDMCTHDVARALKQQRRPVDVD